MPKTITRRDFLTGSALSAVVLGASNWMAQLDEQAPAATATEEGAVPFQWTAAPALEGTDPAVVLLSRATFGARPGDVAKVKQMGLDAWIEQQLHPDSIPDGALDDILKPFPSLTMNAAEMYANYPQLKQAKKGPAPVPDAILGFVSLFDKNGANPTPGQVNGPAQAILELSQAMLLRAMFSERQLFEVMVDFWTNHFNIYILKESDRWYKTIDDREVIRQFALGKFRDLLMASARSPAMLVYLDNVVNRKGVAQENYARELLELHTVGVNGGYTQTDVQELARVLTGWTIRPARNAAFGAMDYSQSGSFLFNSQWHDTGDKTVLGLKLKNEGAAEGEKVIDLLARHPATARFISTKLARRFVADRPPESLVTQMADTFQKSDGDIRQVLGVMLRSDEFKQSFGQKLKRPLEYLVSTVRALSPTLTDPSPKMRLPNNRQGAPPNPAQVIAEPFIVALRTMGQLPYQWPTPDGYPDTAEAWVNTTNILQRWNLALAVVANQIAGFRFDLGGQMQSGQIGTPEQAVDFWTDRLLNRPLPAQDRATLVAHMKGDLSQAAIRDIVALLLASPHFQYR